MPAPPFSAMPDRSFWSFQKPSRPKVPEVDRAELVQNPVDSFLLQALERNGLSYAPQAAPTTLARRVLPRSDRPAPHSGPDRSLSEGPTARTPSNVWSTSCSTRNTTGSAGPQVWLDLAGYADSEGLIDEDRIRPNAWRYRDYVIRALNDDKPYTRFLTEQIAGDELEGYKGLSEVTQETVDRLAATGFLRMASDPTLPRLPTHPWEKSSQLSRTSSR